MKKTENPIFEIARTFANELDLSGVSLIEQAVKFYKKLHSKEDWLESFRQQCEPINQLHLEGKANCHFYDSVLTACIYEVLELKLGAVKSSLQLATDLIMAMGTQLDNNSYEKLFGVYPREAWNKFVNQISESPYPWLDYEENLIVVFMVAYHKWYWNVPSGASPITV